MMLSNGRVHEKENGLHEGYREEYMLNGDGGAVINNNPTEISTWARQAVELMGAGELEKALHFMNLCLDEKFRSKILSEKMENYNGREGAESGNEKYKLSDSDELILLEKRCLVQMRLKMYDKVWEGAARIIAKRSNHTIAFKCIISSLCKADKHSHAGEVFNLWKKCAPNDLDMIEARTTVEGLIDAIKTGIEPVKAFANIEEKLQLTTDCMSGRRIYEPQWNYRPLPPGANAFFLCVQFRFRHCSLGEKCPDAHGAEELEEWKLRYSISYVSRSQIHSFAYLHLGSPAFAAFRNLSNMLACSQLDREASYIKTIMDRMEDEMYLLAKEIPGITVSCDESATTQIQCQSNTMKSHSWNFKIDSTRALTHICLLYEVHRPYFKIGSAAFIGQTNTLNLKTGKLASEPNLQVLEVNMCPTALALTGSLPDSFCYTVEVICTPDVFGTFRQTVLFDFGGEPKLIRNISVEVVPPLDEDCQRTTPPAPKTGEKMTSSLFASNLKTRGTWNFGNADIVDSLTGERVESSKLGFALMTTPATRNRDPVVGDSREHQHLLTKENYRDRMRFFLTQEERSRQVILSKYNISAHLTISDNYNMKGGANEGTRYSVDGNLFSSMSLFRDICEDTPVGRLILRSCHSVLLAKTETVNKSESNGTKPRVYLCAIVEKTKNAMYFEIGKSCVQELKLLAAEVSSFDIQFQLDRTTFMEQKKVIDQLTDLHLDMLFPNFNQNFHIPWSPFMQWNPSVESKSIRLNPKQKEAFNAVTANTSKAPPILIIGPFGTGKTFTLFQCIKKLLDDDTSRIMICTHSNSAADLYIKEYLDPMVKAGCAKARPLRIYYSMRSKLTVHKSIRKYCLYDTMDRFRCPTKEEVMKHRVIVVTLSTSFMLIDLDLPSDAFSHILLDEAAQAMESEAITPLLAAGENTKLVLAGDHMQLSPELFSEDAKDFHASLLERLHCLYPDSHPCKLMLCENYRSHSAIIKFASDSFYQNKLECGMIQPVHARYHPLTFFSARGEDIQDPDSTSYYNMAEVFEVTERVIELINSWPEKWGDWKQDNQIGVLTPYPDQVSRIRQRLRKKDLSSVSVERVLNVQGKQFRAVFLSTVRIHKPWVNALPEIVSDEVDMGFFSNPKLLNTALTRAQSLVAVVGDPVSLCALGKCRRLWEDFISICEENKSLHGMSFDQIKQNILGVKIRSKYGYNPLALEYQPDSSADVAKNAQSSTSSKPLLPTPNTGLVSTSEVLVSRNPAQYPSIVRFNHPQNVWPNMHGPQNLPPNYTQYHPQGQMPVPMIPVPILMNPQPAFNPGPVGMVPPPPFCPQFYRDPALPRPPMVYPPMGPSYIAVPLHHRSASAFAQYRAPQPPHRPPTIGPPNFPPTPHPGSAYPPLLPPQHKIPMTHPSPVTSQLNMHMTIPAEKNPWGQPLYRTTEYHSGPPPPLAPPHLDQRQNNFYPPPPSTWASSNLAQAPRLAPPVPSNAQFRPPQQFQQTTLPPPQPRSAPWPSSGTLQHSTASTSAVNGMLLNQKFSPEELMYLQRILEERNNSLAPTDEAIESIREKLTQAQLQQQQQPGGLNFYNNRPSYNPNPINGPPFSQANNMNMGTQHHAYYQHGEGLPHNHPPPPPPAQHNYGNLANEMNSLHLSYPGPNPWAPDPSLQQHGMNGVMVNGYSSTSHSRPTNNQHGHLSTTTSSSIVPKNETQNPELTVGWKRPQSASVSTNNHSIHENPQMGQQSNSASSFGRSYACAVKQPLTQQNSISPTLEDEDLQERNVEQIISSSPSFQPKPLMEMDVDFPFPLPNYSPPPRARGNTSPAPRFRAANTAKKNKKKK